VVLSQKPIEGRDCLSPTHRNCLTSEKEEGKLKHEGRICSPDKKKKAAAIISMGGRIYELESKSMDVDE
jgi:uncharacterized protein YciI